MFQEMVPLEQVLRKFQDNISIKIPLRLLFQVNTIRKDSIHRTMCLTMADKEKYMFGVIKFPEKISEIANDSLENEFLILEKLCEDKKVSIALPKPVSKFFFQGRLFVIYEYLDHEMNYLEIHKTTEIFPEYLFKNPLLWKLDLEKLYLNSQKKLDIYFLEQFEGKLFGAIKNQEKDLKEFVIFFWKMRKEKLISLAEENLPLTLMHGDFNPWNIGVKKDLGPAVFDWEDADFSYPLMFDFFYFCLIFFQCLSDERFTKIPKEKIEANINQLLELIEQYQQKWLTTFSLKNTRTVNALFLLFLFHCIIIELHEKRKSILPLILRWARIIKNLNGENYLKNYILLEKKEWLKK